MAPRPTRCSFAAPFEWGWAPVPGASSQVIISSGWVFIQRDDGKRIGIDVLAESKDGRVVLVEVRKRETKTGLKAVEDFWEKVTVYAERFPD